MSCWGRVLDPDHPGRFHDAPSPTRVEGLVHAVEISAGETLDCARIDDGTVRCWGSNTLGQLGAGDARLRIEPVTVVGVAGARSVSVGSTHACARVAGSTLRCWGANDFGALGNGTTARSSVSAPVVDLTNASQVVAAGSHTCARTGDGAVWCWGRNIAVNSVTRQRHRESDRSVSRDSPTSSRSGRASCNRCPHPPHR